MRVTSPNGFCIFLSVSLGLSLGSWCASADDSPPKKRGPRRFQSRQYRLSQTRMLQPTGPGRARATRSSDRHPLPKLSNLPPKIGLNSIVPVRRKEPDGCCRESRHRDPDERSPRSNPGRRFHQRKIDLLKRWVAEGAHILTLVGREPNSAGPLPQGVLGSALVAAESRFRSLYPRAPETRDRDETIPRRRS